MGLLLGKDISPLSFNGKGAHLILFFPLVMPLKLLPLSGKNLYEKRKKGGMLYFRPFFALIYAFLHLTKMLTNL